MRNSILLVILDTHYFNSKIVSILLQIECFCGIIKHILECYTVSRVDKRPKK